MKEPIKELFKLDEGDLIKLLEMRKRLEEENKGQNTYTEETPVVKLDLKKVAEVAIVEENTESVERDSVIFL